MPDQIVASLKLPIFKVAWKALLEAAFDVAVTPSHDTAANSPPFVLTNEIQVVATAHRFAPTAGGGMHVCYFNYHVD
jgi:hypothetical protein